MRTLRFYQTWTILITPRSVVDLGVRRLHPEIDLIDDLYDRIKHNGDAADIATHAVIAELKKTIPVGNNGLPVDTIERLWRTTMGSVTEDRFGDGIETIHAASFAAGINSSS